MMNPPMIYPITCQFLPYVISKSVTISHHIRTIWCNPHIFRTKNCTHNWVVPCIFPRFHGVHIVFKTTREHIVIFREVPHVSPWIHQGRFCGPSQRRGAHGERRVLQRCAESRTVQFSHQHRQWLGWDGLTYAPDSLAVCGCCIERKLSRS